MKSSAQVVVIGGGVVGASVLYHLTKAGWTDVMLLERRELSSGSTWHAAGGMHTFNGEANISRLQKYTIDLYREIEALSGQSCGLHPNGGLMLAATAGELDSLKLICSRARYLCMETEMISLEEAKRLNPLIDTRHFIGALWRADGGLAHCSEGQARAVVPHFARDKGIGPDGRSLVVVLGPPVAVAARDCIDLGVLVLEVVDHAVISGTRAQPATGDVDRAQGAARGACL